MTKRLFCHWRMGLRKRWSRLHQFVVFALLFCILFALVQFNLLVQEHKDLENNYIISRGNSEIKRPFMRGLQLSSPLDEPVFVHPLTTKISSLSKTRQNIVKTNSNSREGENDAGIGIENRPNSCSFLNVHPFNTAVMKHVLTHPELDCRYIGLPSVVYIQDSTLRVNFTKVKATLIKGINYCRYTPLTLSSKNDSVLQPPKWSVQFLHEPLKLQSSDEHVFAECYFNNRTVSRTYASRVIEKKNVEVNRMRDLLKHRMRKGNSSSETLSVILIGMDGMSKQNFIRAMPKTRDFILNRLRGKELNKFNKVGENTYPNIIPLFTGLRVEEFEKRKLKIGQHLDEVDDLFLWRKYQMKGYRSLVGFDDPLGEFHGLNRGWKSPAFDYYTRPLVLKLKEERKIGERKKGESLGGRSNVDDDDNDDDDDDDDDDVNCLGDKPEVESMLDYVIQLVSMFNGTKKENENRPYFVYNFFTKLTHYDPNEASKADGIYRRFFETLRDTNVLNRTVIVFFGDHGARVGPIRHTFNGIIETNTPFVVFMFPRWFEKRYPRTMDAFRINQHRLTTFFDIHETLNDLLEFPGKGDVVNDDDNGGDKAGSVDDIDNNYGDVDTGNDILGSKRRTNSRGISLFGNIPVDRMCHDAGISMEFCNCKSYDSKSVDEASTKTYEYLTDYLIKLVSNKTSEYRNECEVLSVANIKSVFSVDLDNDNNSTGTTSVVYLVTIETSPGKAVFEAFLEYNFVRRKLFMVGTIRRLDVYKWQSDCVDAPSVKPFCICR